MNFTRKITKIKQKSPKKPIFFDYFYELSRKKTIFARKLNTIK